MKIKLQRTNIREFKFMGDYGEARYLYSEAKKGGQILEVGTGAGGSSILMAKAMSDFNVEGHIHTVAWEQDFKTYDIVLNHILKFSYSNFITQYRGKSEEFLTIFKNENYKFRFIYIDGDHSYEGVLKDIRNSKPLLVNGGILGFHDTNKIEVRRAIDEELKDWHRVAKVSRIESFSRET